MSPPAPAELFPPGVIFVRGDAALARIPLLPEEEQLTQAMAEARRREFALGRACAREALLRLGVERGPLLRDGRLPRWPAGVVGSLTHTEGFTAAAVASSDTLRGIGIDAEQCDDLSERAAARICAAGEQERLASLVRPPEDPPVQWEKLVFSAKEAFYKAYFPVARHFLGFKDVALDIDPATHRFVARLLRDDKPGPRRAEGRYALLPPHVFCAVTLP